MRRYLLLLPLISVLFITGCTGSSLLSVRTIWSDIKIPGEKVVYLDAERTGWAGRIERKLIKHGYTVIRSHNYAQLKDAPKPRVAIYINGNTSPITSAVECNAYGYFFNDLYLEVIDLETNKTLGSYEGFGYSENCSVDYGDIFQKIFETIDCVWSNPSKLCKDPSSGDYDNAPPVPSAF